LTYITSRGPWYLVSWKGQIDRSGGLATNIGIHFFDLLIWLFGRVEHSEVHLAETNKIGGFIELQNARVNWFLSIDKNDVPADIIEKGQRTFRSITIDGEEIEFSGGFTDLHTIVYRETLAGRGFTLDDARPSIELVHQIRNAKAVGIKDKAHPILRKLK
ncbi:MAG: oxidoreductase, partial [Candidatus Zixiibacteriota bacterium]